MARLESLPQLHEGKPDGGYLAVAFDLDGTLYDQKKLRLIMALRLGTYYLIHPFRIKDLLLLKTFRQVRDHWDEIAGTLQESEACKDPDAAMYAYVANRHGVDAGRVAAVVRQWIYENPLSALPKCTDTDLAAYIASLRQNHIPVLIFSDYPIEDKLRALGIGADGMYAPGDERAIELKPSPSGLGQILADHNLDAAQLLMVGDRDEKDGESARRAGVDYVIVHGKKR